MNIRLDFITHDNDGRVVRWWMEIHAHSIQAGEIIGKNIARNMDNTTFEKAHNWNPEPVA